MKARYSFLLAFLLCLGLGARLVDSFRTGDADDLNAPAEGRTGALVLFVVDGDTVKVSVDGRKEWVRLLRIDTPERDERGYAEAREALRDMAGGRDAQLEFETPGTPARDEHKRLLAYLFVEGRNLNVEMVRAGWSPFWTKYGEGRLAGSFRQAEKEARRERRGLWSGGEAGPR